MKVRAVMNRPVKSVGVASSIAAAGKIMNENDCGVLPVIDEKGQVVGVLTDRDVCLALTEKNRLASDVTVSEAMSPRVFACGPDDEIQNALETMQYRLVRRLPVLDESRRLVGILSIDDVIVHAGPATAKRPPEVTYGEAFSTLKAICGTRLVHPPLIVSP
ncbi:MAG TPA: CBS domain-containing protein [Thermoanaerobaculia bacterium]|nr:CBS domain-containing protein [Thermoanaerobaculia bacterium]